MIKYAPRKKKIIRAKIVIELHKEYAIDKWEIHKALHAVLPLMQGPWKHQDAIKHITVVVS